MSSNAFCMHFEETVKQFIDLRDQSLWKAIELSEKPPIKSSWSKHNLKENYWFFLFFFSVRYKLFLIFQWSLFRQGYKMNPSEIFDKGNRKLVIYEQSMDSNSGMIDKISNVIFDLKLFKFK